MCRLFGFRASRRVQAHRTLMLAENSLVAQSVEHCDGWGFAFYDDAGGETRGRPHLVHGLEPAHRDPEFARVSSTVHSDAILAHIRLASVGPVELKNAHPFSFGPWAFAHNGTVAAFSEVRSAVEGRIAGDFRRELRGDTDSERCFHLFLTRLSEVAGGLEKLHVGQVATALAQTVRELQRLTHGLGEKPSSLNFLVTNGRLMLASRCRRTLFLSADSAGECPGGTSSSPEAELKPSTAPSSPDGSAGQLRPGTPLESLLIASEELCPTIGWEEVDEEEIVGVDEDLTFFRSSVIALAPD